MHSSDYANTATLPIVFSATLSLPEVLTSKKSAGTFMLSLCCARCLNREQQQAVEEGETHLSKADGAVSVSYQAKDSQVVGFLTEA